MLEHPERSPERDAAIEAMLPHVPFDGWTRRAVKAGLVDAGLPVEDAAWLFPGGAADMVETFCDRADVLMQKDAEAIEETRLSKRVRAVIALRLRQNRLYKEAIRRAMSVLALPGNARVAAACTARTVDAIWTAAGDQSAGFSWYTKRAILTGVYSATALYWLRDTSGDDAETLAFLDRRLADVGRIGKLRGRLEGLRDRLPRPHFPGMPVANG